MNRGYKRKLRLVAVGVAAMGVATAIGFLAQEVAEWLTELVFSFDWSRQSKVATEREPAASVA